MTGLLPRRVLPVLMYHRIAEHADGDPALTVSPEVFERHLAWIAARGLRALSLAEAGEAFQSGRGAARSVLLTIDDGFAETLRLAAPLLRRRRIRAAVFVPAKLVGCAARLEPSYGGSGIAAPTNERIADRAELESWIAAGNEVGSHSLTHADLTALPVAEVAREAVESKRILEDLLGRPVEDFCYPYAHHDEAARRAVREAGYRAAYAGEPPTSSRWAVPRMMVFPDDGARRFGRKLSGYYYWLAAWHRRLRGGGARGAAG